MVMDEPKQGYYGGQIAAPVFKQIAEKVANYLNIRPEDGEGLPVPGNAEALTVDRPLKTAAARTQ